jgi:RimJ/RimL family protein N-acetyltransferase
VSTRPGTRRVATHTLVRRIRVGQSSARSPRRRCGRSRSSSAYSLCDIGRPHVCARDRQLRDVTEADLPIFFEFERDPVANEMAAFPARDREAFMQHWTANILGNDTGRNRTILLDDVVVGNILSWEQSGDRRVGYWIGREYWGRGVASRALAIFLVEVDERPLHAYVAAHNAGSIRVLEKSGFRIVRAETNEEPGVRIDELLFRLDAD